MTERIRRMVHGEAKPVRTVATEVFAYAGDHELAPVSWTTHPRIAGSFMKLPNHELAMVPQAKMVDYLLSDTHRDGWHKAAFFRRFGFTVAEWGRLAQALQEHAAEHEVTRVEASPYGQRCVIEGIIRSPDGRNPLIRAVWFVEKGEAAPRFVTAYPLRRDTNDERIRHSGADNRPPGARSEGW